jgi:hypothetical protein
MRCLQQGGSWEVRVSLAGVGQWLRDLGQLPPELAFRGQPLLPRTVPLASEIQEHAEDWTLRAPKEGIETAGIGSLVALKSAVELSGVPCGQRREVPSSLDCDSLVWL